MPSTVYQAVAREYVSSTPIVQSYEAFRTQLLYGSLIFIGLTTGYFYFYKKSPEGPIVPDL